MEITGSCLCQGVRFRAIGTLQHFFLCHCRYCQKDSGSAHSANLFLGDAQLLWLGGENLLTNFCLPGTRHQRSFCAQCGSALPTVQGEGLVVIPAGCVDQSEPLQPEAKIFVASRAQWVDGIPTASVFEQLPE